jgi:hypothetical protein
MALDEPQPDNDGATRAGMVSANISQQSPTAFCETIIRQNKTMTAFLALSVLLLASARGAPPSPIFLSAIGDNANDGLTPATAVQSLARAYALVTAMNAQFGTINVMPGVIPLGGVKFNDWENVTITGADATGDPADYTFLCGQDDHIIVATIYSVTTIVGITFDNCADAITVEQPHGQPFNGYPYIHLNLTNVVFDNTVRAVLVDYQATRLSVTNSRFSNQAVGVKASYGTVSVDINLVNSNFTSTGENVIDVSNILGRKPTTGSLFIKDSVFDATVPGTHFNVHDSFGPVVIVNSTFKGPANNNNNVACSVRLEKVTSRITGTVFESHSDAPALCIAGGSATIIGCEFTGNTGISCNSSATPLNLGIAVVVTNNASLVIDSTKFKSSSTSLAGCVCGGRTCKPLGLNPVPPTTYGELARKDAATTDETSASSGALALKMRCGFSSLLVFLLATFAH